MAPIVHGLEAEYSQQMSFSFLDIDDPRNDTFKEQLGFRYQPHFVLLDGSGTVLQQWIGPVEEGVLREAFEQALQ